MSKGVAQYRLTAVVQATEALVGAPGQRLMGVSLKGGSGTSTAEFYNHLTAATGTAVFVVTTIAYDNKFIDLSEYGGILCATDIWCKVTGTAAIAYCWVG